MVRSKSVDASKLDAAPFEKVMDAGMLIQTAPNPQVMPETIKQSIDATPPAVEPVQFKPAMGGMFSLENLALAEEVIAVPPPMDTPIEIARPPKDKFIRVCPLKEYSVVFPAIQYQHDYLPVMPLLAKQLEYDAALSPMVCRVRFTLCATLGGPFFVWITRVTDKKPSAMSLALDAALDLGRLQWVRIQWNVEKNLHEFCPLQVQHAAPDWPTRPFPEILEAAVGAHRMIMTADHEVLQKLAGKRV
jgi:hypothetical protein